MGFTQEDAIKLMTKAIEIPIEKRKAKEEEAKKILRGVYGQIIDILKEYSDLEEHNYKIIALWIIGTYMHDQFSSYPYLFLNAMKGSGKKQREPKDSWGDFQLPSLQAAKNMKEFEEGTRARISQIYSYVNDADNYRVTIGSSSNDAHIVAVDEDGD